VERSRGEGKNAAMYVGILEDNQDILELFVHMLSLRGHRIETHKTGEALLEHLLTERCALPPSPQGYEVLIVDLGLPGGLSGAEVIARLHRALPPESLPRIVVVTAEVVGEIARVRKDFPSVQVLTKPVKLATLLGAVAGEPSQ
jgi:CheY-like chemotaxis protein